MRRAALLLGLSACSVSAGLPHAAFSTSRGTASSSSDAHTSGPSVPASASTPMSSSATADAGAVALVVPDVMGKTAAEASAIIKAAGFARDVEPRNLGCQGGAHLPGKISCQNPEAGTRVGRNDWVQIDVWNGPVDIGPKQLAPLIGRPLPEVKRRLKEMGYVGELQVWTQEEPTATCHDDLVCNFQQLSLRADDNLVIQLAIPPSER